MVANITVGEIRLYDGVLSRVIRVTDSSAIFLCMTYPYFRLARMVDAVKMDRVAVDLDDLNERLETPSTSVWSLAAWKAEVDRIVEECVDEIEERIEEEDVSYRSKRGDSIIRSTVRTYIKDSDWVDDTVGQEKIIQYCLNYLDVTRETIFEFVPEKDRHRWQSVRKGSALAHLFVDVYLTVKSEAKKLFDD